MNTAGSGQSMTCMLVVIEITLRIKSEAPMLHMVSQHYERPTNKHKMPTTPSWVVVTPRLTLTLDYVVVIIVPLQRRSTSLSRDENGQMDVSC